MQRMQLLTAGETPTLPHFTCIVYSLPPKKSTQNPLGEADGLKLCGFLSLICKITPPILRISSCTFSPESCMIGSSNKQEVRNMHGPGGHRGGPGGSGFGGFRPPMGGGMHRHPPMGHRPPPPRPPMGGGMWNPPPPRSSGCYGCLFPVIGVIAGLIAMFFWML